MLNIDIKMIITANYKTTLFPKIIENLNEIEFSSPQKKP